MLRNGRPEQHEELGATLRYITCAPLGAIPSGGGQRRCVGPTRSSVLYPRAQPTHVTSGTNWPNRTGAILLFDDDGHRARADKGKSGRHVGIRSSDDDGSLICQSGGRAARRTPARGAHKHTSSTTQSTRAKSAGPPAPPPRHTNSEAFQMNKSRTCTRDQHHSREHSALERRRYLFRWNYD
jgi:hypothetical protein